MIHLQAFVSIYSSHCHQTTFTIAALKRPDTKFSLGQLGFERDVINLF